MLASLTGFASALITPPASLALVVVAGLVLSRWRKRTGYGLAAAAAAM